MTHRVCIVIVGAFNLCEFTAPAWAQLLTLIRACGYEYDVYIHVGNEVNIKSPTESEATEMKDALVEMGCHDWNGPDSQLYQYMYHKYESFECIEAHMENIFEKSRIRYMHIDDERQLDGRSSGYGACGYVHSLPDFFATRIFKRLQEVGRTSVFTENKNKYDVFIHMRPDAYVIDLSQIERILLRGGQRQFMGAPFRKDFFSMSDHYFPDIINREVFEKHRDALLHCPTIRTCKYTTPTSIHFEIHERTIFSMLGYEFVRVHVNCLKSKHDLNHFQNLYGDDSAVP